MYTHFYQNSYIIFGITFIVLCILSYFYNKQNKNVAASTSFDWKSPLAISLFVWVIWHFFLYPSKKNNSITADVPTVNESNYSSTSKNNMDIFQPSSKLMSQKINMDIWK